MDAASRAACHHQAFALSNSPPATGAISARLPRPSGIPPCLPRAVTNVNEREPPQLSVSQRKDVAEEQTQAGRGVPRPACVS